MKMGKVGQYGLVTHVLKGKGTLCKRNTLGMFSPEIVIHSEKDYDEKKMTCQLCQRELDFGRRP